MLVYSQNKQGIPSDIFKKMNHEGIIRFGSILIAAVQLLKFSALRLMLPKVFSGLHSVVIGLQSWEQDQVHGVAFPAGGGHSFPLIGLQICIMQNLPELPFLSWDFLVPHGGVAGEN